MMDERERRDIMLRAIHRYSSLDTMLNNWHILLVIFNR